MITIFIISHYNVLVLAESYAMYISLYFNSLKIYNVFDSLSVSRKKVCKNRFPF